MKTLAASSGEAVLVAGIGLNAVTLLCQAGIRVYRCDGQTVREPLDRLRSGRLRDLRSEDAHTGDTQADSPGTAGTQGTAAFHESSAGPLRCRGRSGPLCH